MSEVPKRHVPFTAKDGIAAAEWIEEMAKSWVVESPDEWTLEEAKEALREMSATQFRPSKEREPS